MNTNKNIHIDEKTGETLYGFQFLFENGTIATIFAPNSYTAGKMAREMYYGA